MDMDRSFSPDEPRIASYNWSVVAGRAVYRRRMGQERSLELDRSTQLPLGWAKRQEQSTWSSSA